MKWVAWSGVVLVVIYFAALLYFITTIDGKDVARDVGRIYKKLSDGFKEGVAQ